MAERLQKVMAQAGHGSRRHCEDLIRAGRVVVNGQIAILGSKVDLRADEVRVDGERLQKAEPHVYLALYKPRGFLSSLRSQGDKQTVRDLVPQEHRLYPVGRLDVDSEGLILMMNDGQVAHQLTHPRFGHEKEYRVLLSRRPDESQIAAWRRGVVLPDGKRTLSARVSLEDPGRESAWVRIIMREGRKRQIRDIAASLGLTVKRLIRIRQGPIHLGNLKPGEYRVLTDKEIGMLTSLVKGRGIHRKSRVRTSAQTAKH